MERRRRDRDRPPHIRDPEKGTPEDSSITRRGVLSGMAALGLLALKRDVRQRGSTPKEGEEIYNTCRASLKPPQTFSGVEFDAVRKQILASLPRLTNGSYTEVLDELRRITPRLETLSFVSGRDFFEDLNGYPGVRITEVLNERTNVQRVLLQSVRDLGVPYGRYLRSNEMVTHAANGTVIEHEGGLYVLTNEHFLELVNLVPKGARHSRSDYHRDVALLELPGKWAPSIISPMRLSQKSDSDLLGRPFFIPGISPHARRGGIESLVVTTGFAMPLPAELFTRNPSLPRQLYTHGGFHKDCIPEGNLFLGGISGSPVFDYLDRSLIGVFFGGRLVQTPHEEVFKTTEFTASNRILDGLKRGIIPIARRADSEWML